MDALELNRIAQAGDPAAMLALADLINEADPEDPAARDWYARAAGPGRPDAMYAFGVILRYDGDEEAAEPWLRRAAAAGHTDAMVELGHFFDHLGEPEQAMRWYRCAAEAGNTDGAANLTALTALRGRPA